MENTKKSLGPVITVIVILVVLIAAAFYFWGGKLSVSTNGSQSQTAAVAPVSKSDDVSAIEADLKATNTQVDTSGLTAN